MRHILLAAALALSALTPLTAQAFGNVTYAAEPRPAPAEAIIYGDGRTGSLADFRGKVTVVTFWQEHCPFCAKEMPELDWLAGELGPEGLEVLPLSLDPTTAEAQAYLDRRGLKNLRPTVDKDKLNGSIMSIENFGRFAIATPTTFILDKSGAVAASIWGLPDWRSDEAKTYLRGLMAAK